MEATASVMPGMMATPQHSSTLKITPGCPSRVQWPMRTGQPLIADMVSVFSIPDVVLPLIAFKPLQINAASHWHTDG
jgi:hypothetical protein